jgi:methionyl-tRNA synthetase
MEITIDQFNEIEIKIGTVQGAERIPDSDKLLRLQVDLGEGSIRQILSGIAQFVSPEDLIGRQFPFITNLAPRVIRGLVSNGMLLGVGEGDTFSLISPQKTVQSGSRVR